MKLVTPISQIDFSPLYTIGTKTTLRDGNEYVYLRGVAGTMVGSWIIYNHLGDTALIAVGLNGPIAIAMAPIIADRWGWYCIQALRIDARIAPNTPVNASIIGRQGADGDAGSGMAAGDEIFNVMCRAATGATAAVVPCQINYSFVR